MKVSVPLRRQRGLTLLELIVVSAILGLLSAIISLSVMGRSTESRAAAKEADVGTVQRAMDTFTGEHPQSRYPTLNGCAPGRILDLITLTCAKPGDVTNAFRTDTANLQFSVDEARTGVDLNKDGDLDGFFDVAPIIWNKAFRRSQLLTGTELVKTFLLDFVRQEPKHAFEFLGGIDESWEDGENLDPDRVGNVARDSALITAPAGIGAGDNLINTVIDQVPVWVIGVFDPNRGVEVRNLVPDSKY